MHRELIAGEIFRERGRLTLGMQIVADVVLELDLSIPRLKLHVWQTLHPARCF